MSASRKRKKRRHSVALAALFCALACYFVAYFISLRVKINDREAAITELKAEYGEQIDENAELRMILDGGNKSAYIEKIAREKYGYAKPDERVYCDSAAS